MFSSCFLISNLLVVTSSNLKFHFTVSKKIIKQKPTIFENNEQNKSRLLTLKETFLLPPRDEEL